MMLNRLPGQTALRYVVISCFLIFSSVAASYAAKVDTVATFSKSMNKTINAVVILPDSYDNKLPFPVVYLLHGHGGNYKEWVRNVPAIKEYADQHNLMIVCPDGNVSSWYFDSPQDRQWKYETYIAFELTDFIDRKYKTVNNRKGRAITGLSMGGHGALYLAFKHQDVFGAAGSMSGGVDIRPFPLNWNLSKRLGAYAEFPDNWEKNSVINLTHLLAGNNLSLIIDCGKDDFFYNVNVALHEKLLYNNIPHDFTIRPGVHNWDYWSNSIAYQLLYFKNIFSKTK